MAIQYQTYPDVPVVLAMNREEFYARAWLPPAVQPGPPRVLCGTDRRAGGTWLGVNQYGLVVAITNRLKLDPPTEPRSRGTLCRELLDCHSATAAIERAQRELGSGRYAGANYICLDADVGAIVQFGDKLDTLRLSPGLHLLSNCDPNDPRDVRQTYFRELLAEAAPDTARQFADAATNILSRGVDATGTRTIVVRREDRGTVSSTVLGIGREPADSFFRFAPGAPDRRGYEDLPHLLREVLSGDRADAPRRRRGSE